MKKEIQIKNTNAAPGAFQLAIQRATQIFGFCSRRVLGNIKIATWSSLPGSIQLIETVRGDGSITLTYIGAAELASDILGGPTPSTK